MQCANCGSGAILEDWRGSKWWRPSQECLKSCDAKYKPRPKDEEFPPYRPVEAWGKHLTLNTPPRKAPSEGDDEDEEPFSPQEESVRKSSVRKSSAGESSAGESSASRRAQPKKPVPRRGPPKKPEKKLSARESSAPRRAKPKKQAPRRAPPPKPEKSEGGHWVPPEGWSEAVSKSTGRKYYVNTITGVSTYDRPTAPAMETLPPLWEARVSRSNGETYYFNTKTRETKWERPASLEQGSEPKTDPEKFKELYKDKGKLEELRDKKTALAKSQTSKGGGVLKRSRKKRRITQRRGKYPLIKGGLFYLNKKSKGKKITPKLVKKYSKTFRNTR